eukprot:scaffold1785_cov247-Pinguiococcus_pyrenoidosus.AAC.19
MRLEVVDRDRTCCDQLITPASPSRPKHSRDPELHSGKNGKNGKAERWFLLLQDVPCYSKMSATVSDGKKEGER